MQTAQHFIIDLLKPENDFERFLLEQPEICAGLMWGEPRRGHPEGKVLYHVVDLYDNIDDVRPRLSENDRRFLRVAALTHDSFKYQEFTAPPRDWTKHHSVLARRYLEQFIKDENMLSLVELHDEAYYCWRLLAVRREPEKSAERLTWLMKSVAPFLQLYYTFFKCDTWTGDKTQAPVQWFESVTPGIQKIWFE